LALIPGYEEARTLRALITGIAGFAGSHLADYLLGRGDVQVAGISLPADGTRNVQHILARITLCPADLSDSPRVCALCERLQPDLIFHLAAQASVERSWQNPAETLVNNVTAQLNLLQAMVDLQLRCRMLVVGSADEYGLVRAEDLPIDEDTALRPVNPYAVSKIAQDYLGYQYHLSHGLPVVRVRPFGHIGPRQGPGFAVADFARQIARIEASLQEPLLRVGNLSAQRDLTDVRDMVRGYYLALTKGKAGEVYNLGSSRAYVISDVLSRLLEMSQVPVRVEMDTSRLRPSDVPVLISDSRRIKADTGWEPQYDTDVTLREVLDYWRQRVHAEGADA
jgi:GDP-4-dehydro-6-deoxy-D-mannose reductase